MKFGVLLVGIGLSLFVGNFIWGVSVYALMAAQVIEFGRPPTYLWIWLVGSIWTTAIGGAVCGIATLTSSHR